MNILMIGAHPDDCEVFGGGTAALFSRQGHHVKFISTTNGDAGHHELSGEALVTRRSTETIGASRILGVSYEIFDNHDGQLEPSLSNRNLIIQRIREWEADIVITHRPNDYHPDHRYTSQMVQDAAYMVMVPNIVSGTVPLRKNPLFLYFQDHFQRPYPFQPHIVLDITETYETKMKALHAHESQFYEWLPWIEGKPEEVPKEAGKRLEWLKKQFTSQPGKELTDVLTKHYVGRQVKHAEAFEISEYGHQPEEEEIRELVQMLSGSEWA
jgi:LmbE family N-acetylglucosaminyl deacetylase